MGCGGSKEDVATENTVSIKSLLRLKSTVQKSSTSGKTAAGADQNVQNSISNTAEAKELEKETEKPSMTMVSDEKAVANEAKEVEQGKVISKDSPDLYFSSRKDEVDVEGVNIPAAAAAASDVKVHENEGANADNAKTTVVPLEEVEDKEIAAVVINEASNGDDANMCLKDLQDSDKEVVSNEEKGSDARAAD